MKKWIAACFLPFVLTACGSGEYVHSQEPRSTVYYGQPVADLYENFGTPTKATRTAENERILIYMFQEVEKEWAYRYVRGCVMKFYLVNERVVDWTADGQACVIQSRTASDIAGSNMYFDNTISTGNGQVPADAFDGAAPTSYSPIRSATVPGNTFSGKASGSRGISGQLPADAFDGKASATYTKPYILENQSGSSSHGISQLPDDAFGGQASTFYKSGSQIQSTGSTSMPHGLPADAFDGQASSAYKPAAQQIERKTYSAPASTNTESFDDEEWGLFD